MAMSDPGDVDYKISFWTYCGDVIKKEGGQLTISFRHGLVFRGHIEKEIGIDILRWISSHTFSRLSEKVCIIVSYLDDASKDVANVFFELEVDDADTSSKCISTLRELLTIKYEGCTDDLGKVGEVVTMVSNQPIFMGITEMTVHTTEEGFVESIVEVTTGEKSEFLMILDLECMCLYRGDLKKPVHALMFWEEESVNSIEKVKLTQIPKQASSPEKIIFFQTKTTSVSYVASEDIVKHLQNLTPKKRHLMTDPQLMLEVMPKMKPTKPVGWSSGVPAVRSEWEQGAVGGSGYGFSQPLPDEQIAQRLKRELENAIVTFEGNEDMQIMWVANECDIKEIIDNGTAPSTDYRSGGMDSDNGEHLEKALQDVIDQLRENNLRIALSRIQACRDLFGTSNVAAIRHIFDIDDIQLLKSLFFKSLCG